MFTAMLAGIPLIGIGIQQTGPPPATAVVMGASAFEKPLLGPRMTANTEPWQLSDRPVLTLGAVEGTGPDVFGSVAGAVRLSSGAVMIADGKGLNVRLFSSDGEFLNSTGRRGGGPGEFQTMQSMGRCAGDSVFIYDPAQFRVSVFASSGTLARIVDVREATNSGAPPYAFFCNNAGVIAFLHRPPPRPPAGEGPHRDDVAITLVLRDGAVVHLGNFPASERYFDGSQDFPRPLGRRTSIAIGSDVVYLGTGDYVGTGDAFEVAVFSLRGERTRTVRETIPRTSVTATHVAQFINEQVARRSSQDARRAAREFYAGLEYPATFPAFGRLMVDPAANLWIEQYTVPGEEVTLWRVYSRGGAPISTLELPTGFQLMEAGADYVLGVWRNYLGVEFVRIYELIKSSK